MEEVTYFKRGKAHPHKKHYVKPANLHHVPLSASKGCKVSVGEYPKRFPLGWRESGEENSPGDIVCFAKEKAGLGIHSYSIVNRALLGKWVWRSAKEYSIWKEVFRLKYQVEEGGWFTKNLRGSGGVGLRKDISKENK